LPWAIFDSSLRENGLRRGENIWARCVFLALFLRKIEPQWMVDTRVGESDERP